MILRLSIFCVYRLFAYFTKVCTKNHHIFHFFQTIASCDHQSTSGHLAECPFSLLLAILPFSYDFSNKNICKLNILISLLSTDRYIRLFKHVPLTYFDNICIFSTCFVRFKKWDSMFAACNFHAILIWKCIQISYFENTLRCWSIIPCCVHWWCLCFSLKYICIFQNSVLLILRLSIFCVYRLFAYFTKVCAPKSPYFFTFFKQ